jgi:flotillin
MWYYISEPNSYLAITGGGIETVKIVKKAFVMPWQKVSAFALPALPTHPAYPDVCFI